MPNTQTKTIAIIGATGSIGQSALDVIRQHPGRFSPVFLASGGNAQKLARAAREFHPACVGIADPAQYLTLKELLSGTGIEVIAGQ